ncbi:hypothetical protein C8R45DRAFT_1097005 [Mycena sanguinolenta]|nr:hypothetical protein C8R45DRAFT_1097005 [Mycena sanguinolenta]
MKSTIFMALLVLTTGAIARNCTPGLDYCGRTLLDIGKYQPQIDQALHDAGAGEANGGADDLFHCVGGTAVLINILLRSHLGGSRRSKALLPFCALRYLCNTVPFAALLVPIREFIPRQDQNSDAQLDHTPHKRQMPQASGRLEIAIRIESVFKSKPVKILEILVDSEFTLSRDRRRLEMNPSHHDSNQSRLQTPRRLETRLDNMTQTGS